MPRITSFPKDDATNGWTRILKPRVPMPVLKAAETADVLVIGAGFAGLAAAWRYAERRPNERVVVLEAQMAGDGASGRNSGFVLGIRHKAEGANEPDLEPAQRIRRISQAATQFLDGIVTKHQIRCDWKPDGMYIAAVGPKGEQGLEDLSKELDRLGEKHRVLDSAGVRKETGVDHYRSMLYSPNCILMQPAKLMRGLADALPANVSLYEQSPVVSIDYGSTIVAHTAKGSVRAPKLILAVNGFAPEFGFFKRRIFPMRLDVTLTRPLTAAEQKALGADPWGILPAIHTSSPTLRYTEDRRILIRWGYGLSLAHDPRSADPVRVRREHTEMFRKRFPMLPDVEIEHMWAGFVCLSRNYAHGLSLVADNVYTAVCENGVGATKSTVSGICAADMAMGESNPLADDLKAFGEPRQVPPSPFFEIGVSAKRRFEAWRDRTEA